MRTPLAIIVTAGLVLTGCSDDPAEDGLLGALGRVRATAETRVAVEFGQPAAVQALLDKDKARYQTLQGYGYSTIARYGVIVEDVLGLDFDGFDGAIFVGEPPKQAAVLWGEYDVSAVDGKLRDLGIDSEAGLGGSRWRSGDDYEFNVTGGPFPETMAAGQQQFNNIVTRDGSFAYAPAEEGVDWVTEPGDTTLADDDVLAPLATCLGDVIAAQLTATGLAVGVREDGTEVICLDGDRAQVSDALKGDLPSTREPWEEVLPGAEVSEDGSLVRVTAPARDGKPVGRVLRMMATRDLDALR